MFTGKLCAGFSLPKKGSRSLGQDSTIGILTILLHLAPGDLNNIARARDLFVVDMDTVLSDHAEYFRNAVHFNPVGSAA